MNRSIKLIYVITVFMFFFAWAFSSDFIPDVYGYFQFRFLWVQFSGFLTLGLASVGVILATRTSLIEQKIGGLDKMYQLHRLIGSSVLCISVFHWLLAKGTKWAVGWGWLPKPEFGALPQRDIGHIEQLFKEFRPDALLIGEWAFYILTVVTCVALVPFFSYRIFRKLHSMMPLIYLALIIHGITVLNFELWKSVVGWVLSSLIVLGLFSLTYLLWRKVTRRAESKGVVNSFNYDNTSNIVHLEITLSAKWCGHKAGQFAFIRFNKSTESHPFTITNSKKTSETCLTFSIRTMGDYTRQLPIMLKVGLEVAIEGPYGGFTFDEIPRHQYWIASGIGITPFMAKLDELRQQDGVKNIQLFYISTNNCPVIDETLRTKAKQARVTLHRFEGRQQARLELLKVITQAVDWEKASFWFCGPQSFGKEVSAQLRNRGLAASQFHQELYLFRH